MSKKTSPLDWEEFADFLQRQRNSQGIIGGMERYAVPSDNTRTVQTTHARTEGKRQQGVRKAIVEENKLRDKEHRPHISTEAQLTEARQMRKAATDLANNMGYIRGIDVVNNPTEKIQGSIQQMGLNVDPTTYTYGSPGAAYNKGKSLATGTAYAAPLFTGFVTAPIQTGTSLLTGIGGGYAGTKAGEAAADYFGVKGPTDRAWMTVGGGFLGGMIGGGLGYKVGDVVANNYSFMLPRPYGEDTMYRQGTRGIIDDAYQRGAVLPQSAENIAKAVETAPKFQTPDGTWHSLYKAFDNNIMFNKGTPFYGNPAFGAKPRNGYNSVIIGDARNPNIQWSRVHHKGHKGIYEPTTNGVLGSPAENFDYWQRMPLNFG